MIPQRADKAHERFCPLTFSSPPQVNETPAGRFGCIGPACMWWMDWVQNGDQSPREVDHRHVGLCAAVVRKGIP